MEFAGRRGRRPLRVGGAYGIRGDTDCHGPEGPRNDRGDWGVDGSGDIGNFVLIFLEGAV